MLILLSTMLLSIIMLGIGGMNKGGNSPPQIVSTYWTLGIGFIRDFMIIVSD